MRSRCHQTRAPDEAQVHQAPRDHDVKAVRASRLVSLIKTWAWKPKCSGSDGRTLLVTCLGLRRHRTITVLICERRQSRKLISIAGKLVPASVDDHVIELPDLLVGHLSNRHVSHDGRSLAAPPAGSRSRSLSDR